MADLVFFINSNFPPSFFIYETNYTVAMYFPFLLKCMIYIIFHRFPESVTIRNDVGQISNCYLYFSMTLNAIYIFQIPSRLVCIYH